MEEKVNKEIIIKKENTDEDDAWYKVYKAKYFMYVKLSILALIIMGILRIAGKLDFAYREYCWNVSMYFPLSVSEYNEKLIIISGLKDMLIPLIVLIIIGIYFLPCRIKNQK